MMQEKQEHVHMRNKIREEVLERATRRHEAWNKDLPSSVEMLTEARKERDIAFDELINKVTSIELPA